MAWIDYALDVVIDYSAPGVEAVSYGDKNVQLDAQSGDVMLETKSGNVVLTAQEGHVTLDAGRGHVQLVAQSGDVRA